MARYAIVHPASGIVVNVVEWDGNTATWQPPEGYQAVEDSEAKAGVGMTYKNGAFVPLPGGRPGEEAPAEGGTS